MLFPVSAGSSSLLSTVHQESSHPYHLNKAEAMAAHNGTPVPPRYLIRDHSVALSPTVFATDKGIPVSLSHHYAGVASSSNALHFQQGLLASANHENPRFVTFTPPSAQHQLDYGSPGEHDIRQPVRSMSEMSYKLQLLHILT